MQDAEGNEIRTVRPFATATQYMDWERANCGQCAKAASREDFENGKFNCSIEKELAYGTVDDGTISDDAAERMDYHRYKGRYVWRCGAFVPKSDNPKDMIAAELAEGSGDGASL